MEGSALEGVKVLELCSFVAGPFAAKLLADMGADVVKLEPPGGGDEARKRGPFYKGQRGPDTSLLFIYLNSNKQGVTLNISTPAGKQLLLELLRRADILIEDLPFEAIEGLGLEFASLHELNPQLLVTSITPFGRSGPYRDHKAYYLNTYHAGGDGYLLPGGRLPDQLYPDREPIKAGGYLGEYQAGLSAAAATAAALLGRAMDGQGRHLDVSKQEALINLNAADFCLSADRSVPMPRRGQRLPYYNGGIYRCKDGFWQLVIPSQRQWEGMVQVMGRPSWTEEERFATQESRVAHRDEVDERIEEWAMGCTREEIYHRLQQQGCAAGPVYSTREVFEDRQMEHRGFFADVEHPSIGKFKAPLSPWQFSGTPLAIRRPAPTLGQHNSEVYGDWLGYDVKELGRLRRTGVI